MEKICVYTCITGSYDNLKEVKVNEENIDYICFTNNKQLTSSTWKIIYIEDDKLSNHYLSRKLKMIGDSYIDENYTLSIWIDASVIFKKSVKEFLNEYFDYKNDVFLACKHHLRNSIAEEAKACIRYKKGNKERIDKLLSFYKQENFKDDLGLLEMTLIVKRHNDPLVRKTMKLWFDMILNYSERDQLSFMYCIYKTGLKVKAIPLNVWNNNYLEFTPHNMETYDYKYQVYYDYGNGFNEEDSEIFYYTHQNNICFINLDIKMSVKKLRIDFSDISGVCFEFIDCKGIEKKDLIFVNYLIYKDKYISNTADPQVIINKGFKENDNINISLKMLLLDKEHYLELIKELVDLDSETKEKYNLEINKLKGENENLKQEIAKLLNSLSWKVTKPLRKMSGKIKK